MANKIHFVAGIRQDDQLPSDRVTVDYASGSPSKIRYLLNNKKVMSVHKHISSLILIDNERDGINKLHVGELMFWNPHAESSLPGIRVDLHELDLDYAKLWLNHLNMLRDESYRKKLVDAYSIADNYFTQKRLEELNVSGDDLEKKIAEFEQHIAALEGCNSSLHLSCNVKEIEDIYASLYHIVDVARNNNATRSRILIETDVLEKAGQIRQRLTSVLDHVAENADMEKAKAYWD